MTNGTEAMDMAKARVAGQNLKNIFQTPEIMSKIHTPETKAMLQGLASSIDNPAMLAKTRADCGSDLAIIIVVVALA